jgi:hypothetical protein
MDTWLADSYHSTQTNAAMGPKGTRFLGGFFAEIDSHCAVSIILGGLSLQEILRCSRHRTRLQHTDTLLRTELVNHLARSRAIAFVRLNVVGDQRAHCARPKPKGCALANVRSQVYAIDFWYDFKGMLNVLVPSTRSSRAGLVASWWVTVTCWAGGIVVGDCHVLGWWHRGG